MEADRECRLLLLPRYRLVMQIEIRVEGDVVERTELLNGTCTIAIEGATTDDAWQVAGVWSWNRGLVDYAGEGDLSLKLWWMAKSSRALQPLMWSPEAKTKVTYGSP